MSIHYVQSATMLEKTLHSCQNLLNYIKTKVFFEARLCFPHFRCNIIQTLTALYGLEFGYASSNK